MPVPVERNRVIYRVGEAFDTPVSPTSLRQSVTDGSPEIFQSYTDASPQVAQEVRDA